MTFHALARIADLIRDPRMIHNMSRTYLKTRELTRLIDKEPLQREICIALTFDVEHEYGSRRVTGDSAFVNPFLSSLKDFSSKTTIFIEGSLVQENSKVLRSLENRGFEIGLHGYRHELWGPAQWYLGDRPISAHEKGVLLEKSKETFRHAGLRSPVSFRAPNLVSDRETVRLLIEYGFRVDSSLPSHKGVFPVDEFGQCERLVRIPVSVDPQPQFSHTFLVPHLTFRVCNLETLTHMTPHEYVEFALRVASIQKALGFRPHLVALAHSWEFFEPLSKRRQYEYCSPRNFKVLQDFLEALSNSFDLRQMQIGTLARELTDRLDCL